MASNRYYKSDGVRQNEVSYFDVEIWSGVAEHVEFKPQITASAGPGDSNEPEEYNLNEALDESVSEEMEEVLI